MHLSIYPMLPPLQSTQFVDCVTRGEDGGPVVDLDRFGQTIPCEDRGEGVDEGVPPPPPPAPQVRLCRGRAHAPLVS